MIYEFAVEPEVVASWCDPNEFRFFDRKFGPGTCRVLCRYPGKKWEDLVVRAFQKMAHRDAAQKQSRKKRLTSLLRHLKQRCSNRGHGWKQEDGWRSCAFREHTRRPFQALVVQGDARESSAIDASQVGESNPLWNPPSSPVRRDASDYAVALGGLLRCCQQLKLVDPYFELHEDRYRLPVLALIEAACSGREPGELPRIEVHTSVDREFKGRDAPIKSSAALERSADSLIEGFSTKLPASPQGLTLHVFVWTENQRAAEGFENLHNRYVLTEVGGVALGHGLDQGRGTDDFSILAEKNYTRRWDQYSRESSAFRLVRERKLE